MRRKSFFVIAGALVLTLTACNFNGKGNGTKTEIAADGEITDAKPDNGEEEEQPEIKAETVVTEENMEYYAYYDGSSSVCERGALYKYKGRFILVIDYFNCGDECMETYPLSDEEAGLFIEEINAAIAKKAEKEKGEEKEKEDEETAGGSTIRAGVLAGGVYYPAWLIDLEALGIKLLDVYKADYPSEEEAEAYKIEGFLELQEKAQWDEGPVSIGGREFQRSVGKQIEEQSGEEIEQMTIDSFHDEDFELRVETEDGETYKVTVTYSGYVVKVEKE